MKFIFAEVIVGDNVRRYENIALKHIVSFTGVTGEIDIDGNLLDKIYYITLVNGRVIETTEETLLHLVNVCKVTYP